VVLAYRFGAPAIHRFDRRKFAGAPAQYRFGRVLRQSLIVGEIERTNEFALQPVMVVAAEQRSIGGHAADAVFPRDGPRRPQFLLSSPEVEMLHRPLGHVLALRDGLRIGITLHRDRRESALPEFDGEPQADGPAANDDDLWILSLRSVHGSRLFCASA
jgi:hypothetical protein